jgi:predicted phosphodiesterase
MIHDIEPEDRPMETLARIYLQGRRPDVLITGHTHFERLAYDDGVMQVNPGSSHHPHNFSTRPGTVALLDLEPSRIEATVVRLAEKPGLRNPGHELSLNSFDRVVQVVNVTSR